MLMVETVWSRSGTGGRLHLSLLTKSSQRLEIHLGTRDAEFHRCTAEVISASVGGVCQEFHGFMSRDYYYLIH